jgi:hypothetical protein
MSQKKGNTTLIIIATIVIVFILIVPSLLSFGSKLLNDLADFVKNGLGSTGTLGNSSQNGLSIDAQLIATYADGTTQRLDTRTASILGLTVSIGGKEITQIEYVVYVGLQFSGAASANVQVKYDLSVDVYDESGSQRQYLGELSGVPSGIKNFTYNDNETKQVTANQVYASTIDSFMASKNAQSGTHYCLEWDCNVQAIATFPDGSRDQKAATNPMAIVSFEYAKPAIKALTISISKNVFW